MWIIATTAACTALAFVAMFITARFLRIAAVPIIIVVIASTVAAAALTDGLAELDVSNQPKATDMDTSAPPAAPVAPPTAAVHAPPKQTVHAGPLEKLLPPSKKHSDPRRSESRHSDSSSAKRPKLNNDRRPPILDDSAFLKKYGKAMAMPVAGPSPNPLYFSLRHYLGQYFNKPNIESLTSFLGSGRGRRDLADLLHDRSIWNGVTKQWYARVTVSTAAPATYRNQLAPSAALKTQLGRFYGLFTEQYLQLLDCGPDGPWPIEVFSGFMQMFPPPEEGRVVVDASAPSTSAGV
ncbi:hypothetical protein AAVH_39218 [Aphelenchoides avenae]|nr:hypothetical protein AAVH_39218 [Aphelenchus avenae]